MLAWVHGYMRAWVHACMGTCVHGYMRAWVHACMGTCVHGYMRAWVHACLCVSYDIYAWNCFSNILVCVWGGVGLQSTCYI